MICSADLPTDLPVLAAFEDHYRAGYVDPWHAHEHAQLAFASSGVQVINTDGASFILPPNRAIWIPPGTNHQTICRSDVVFQVVYVDRAFRPHNDRCHVFEASALLRALIGEVVALAGRYDSDARSTTIVELLLGEIDRMPDVPVQAELPADRRLRRVCEAILADPGDSRDIDYWARQAGMSRRTFTRSFRDETGMGLATWRRQVRVMEAASRISAGEAITSVAYDVGYDSPSAFTAMFHRTFGATPSAYCRR
jgi:AraC-like DNA-binding protein